MSTISHMPLPHSVDSLAEASGAPRPIVQSPTFASNGTVDAAVLALPRPPAPAPTAEPEIPLELEALARKVARGSLEVLGGTRPLQQMARLLDGRSYERLQLRSNLVRSIDGLHGASPRANAAARPLRLHRNILIRAVRICAITPSVFEASVVAAEQKRARAIALRIERWRGQWRVTELEIG